MYFVNVLKAISFFLMLATHGNYSGSAFGLVPHFTTPNHQLQCKLCPTFYIGKTVTLLRLQIENDRTPVLQQNYLYLLTLQCKIFH